MSTVEAEIRMKGVSGVLAEWRVREDRANRDIEDSIELCISGERKASEFERR